MEKVEAVGATVSSTTCAALLVTRMKQLAHRFRENKAEIDNLRWQLTIVRMDGACADRGG
jgi:hypothetical protein